MILIFSNVLAIAQAKFH